MKSSRLMMAGRFFYVLMDIGDCKRKHQDPPFDDFERIVRKIHHGEAVEEDADEGGPEESDL
jgi:hypothetical protein